MIGRSGQSFFTQDCWSIGLTLTEATMIGHWLAGPLQSIYEMANLRPIIFASVGVSPIDRQSWVKNDWPLLANHFWLKNHLYIRFALLEAKMIGHRLANHHIQILGNGLANPWPIIFASSRANPIYRWILSQKWLATDGQSILTQESPIYMVRSAGSKNDWP